MAVITPAFLDELARRYQQALGRLQLSAEAAALDAWYSLGGVDDETKAEWLRIAEAIYGAAAASLAQLVKGYLDAQMSYLGLALPSPAPDWESSFEDWGSSPIVVTRWLLSAGIPFDEALSHGGTRTTKIFNAALRNVEQQALITLADNLADSAYLYVGERPDTFEPVTVRTQDQLDEAVIQMADRGYPMTKRTRQALKYRRLTEAGACGFCRLAADRLYSIDAERASPTGDWHTYCRCTWREVTIPEAKEWEQQYAGADWRSVIKERADVPGDERNTP